MNNKILAGEVNSRISFIEFIERLRDDLNENSNDWENKTLGDFLVALGAYAEDIQGYYDNTKQPVNADVPSWKVFADLLTGATMYE
ncbi:DUF7660 family protein [Mucilaginibacter sp. FT3.2]|uniref:DUF7660 family protein n=1 Tax=Mucilaginibacter sp. FT3.2 TaxID=2723090 RepID=UPI001622FAF6|nr:hypothetical protein [Mucilaginibacter sp. FT3.2]MBB6229621.1 hypothetical protein [Mucilaginibacter sp. FT3.2]